MLKDSLTRWCAGADVNAVSNEGVTALHLVVARPKSTELLQLLLEKARHIPFPFF
jgi:ankyrin repeat protein